MAAFKTAEKAGGGGAGALRARAPGARVAGASPLRLCVVGLLREVKRGKGKRGERGGGREVKVRANEPASNLQVKSSGCGHKAFTGIPSCPLIRFSNIAPLPPLP